MRKETMTPKERWLAVLHRKLPDRIPMDYWTTPEARDRLLKHLGCAEGELFDRLHIDRIVAVGPEYIGPKLPPDTDIFGWKYGAMKYETGVYSEVVSHPLAPYNSVAEIEANYTWPSADWFDYSTLPKKCEGRERYPIRAGGLEPFYLYGFLRGDMQAYMDLIEHPDMVHYCLDKICAYQYEMTRRIFETIPGKVNMSYLAEDMGSQESLLFSPAQIREFLLPNMKKIADLVHQAGAFAFHHNDGAIRAILPELIGIGIDILNPVQWRCKGMDREGLKRDFGDKLVFHGAMDNQQTLPFGSVEDVRREVLDNIRILGKGGGYVLAPCHNIQAVSAVESIVAMYETCYENGWY